jgi:hypothetical protein
MVRAVVNNIDGQKVLRRKSDLFVKDPLTTENEL